MASIRLSLDQFGVPRDAIDVALHLIPDDAVGVLLYGSWARRDQLPDSDLDLLVLVPTPLGSQTAERVSVSCYTSEQLQSASGTIFGMHLQRDGRALWDPGNYFYPILRAYRPAEPYALLSRIRHLAAVLDPSSADASDYLSGLVRCSRWLLRTAVYAEALRLGRPCFSVRELAERFEEPALATLLSSRHDVDWTGTVPELSELAGRLERLAGTLPANRYGSLVALAVYEWYEDRERSTIAILAMSGDEHFDYSQLPKVLL